MYVSCYIPSIKQTVMRILQLRAESTILEARDHILMLLGLGEKKVLTSLGLEREEYLFSGTQVYMEALHTYIDVLHLREEQKLEPCYTLQEEFLRHQHRSPRPNDIFKLRLVLPRFNEEAKEDDGTEENKGKKKRNLEETSSDAGPSSPPSILQLRDPAPLACTPRGMCFYIPRMPSTLESPIHQIAHGYESVGVRRVL